MKGLQIFMHSVRQVLGNLVPALQVSAVLFGVQQVFVILLGGRGSADNMVLGIVGMLVIAATSLWIAVGWHRYVLLNEQPSIVPPVHMDRLVAYLIKTVIIVVILIIPSIVTVLVLGPLAPKLAMSGGMFALTLVSGVITVPLFTLFLMFSPALPGTAVSGQSGLNAAFNATKGDWVQMFVLAAAVMLLQVAAAILGLYVFSKIPMGLMVWNIVSGWFVTMVGISVITTLYGHYMENRALT